MSQSQENLPRDGRTDGRTDRPYFIGPFWLMPGFQKFIFIKTGFLLAFFLSMISEVTVFWIEKVNYQPSLLNQKHNVGWFLIKWFVDLFREYFSQINRNHTNMFLLLY